MDSITVSTEVYEKRFFVTENAIIDLAEVSMVHLHGEYAERNDYVVSFKNGAAVPVSAKGLLEAYKKYLGL